MRRHGASKKASPRPKRSMWPCGSASIIRRARSSGPIRSVLDEVLAVLEGLQRETGDDRYRPAPLMKKLVIAGFLGETSGRGFYAYKEGQVKP